MTVAPFLLLISRAERTAIIRAEDKRTPKTDVLQRGANDTGLQRLEVHNDVRQLRHGWARSLDTFQTRADRV